MRAVVAACLALTLLVASAASHATDFRVYSVNSDMQLDRIPTFHEGDPGCHNLLLHFVVYRVAQIGYKYCTVYSEKDCKAGSEVQVSWKKKKPPVKQFTQGDRWFLVSDNPHGHKMGSWYCEALRH
ncbi:MAG: hypothetical protein WB783_10175 [Arenicellales bacterium]